MVCEQMVRVCFAVTENLGEFLRGFSSEAIMKCCYFGCLNRVRFLVAGRSLALQALKVRNRACGKHVLLKDMNLQRESVKSFLLL